MTDSIIAIAGIAISAYVAWQLFLRKNTQQQDAQIIDLGKKIDEKTAQLVPLKEEAKRSLEAYEDAKKAYDSNNDPNKPNS